ncbi:MAG TPA: glycosyltransferase family 4 protein [Bryobacteraceae bacterium]|nr:glycosyltransferase family 4 protein [Bryobacteraceae bacterium]
MIAGHHAPPPGSHTGVADYAQALEQSLSKTDTVRRDAAGADVHLYHLGNNGLHREIYRRALEVPGVAILHDAVLHHFLLGTLSEREYLDEFVWNYGEWRRDLARDLWRGRASAGIDPRYFRYPMLRRIVERSLAIIVHNPGAAEMARSAVAQHPPIAIVPHLYIRPGAADEAAGVAFREKLGIPPAATLFGIFGYLREPKRIPACIAAFRRLHAIRPKTALLLAGEIVSKDLERLLAIEAAHPAIRRVAHLKDRDFSAALSAVDCCINLRYPGAGETSGIAIRAMGAGKPVILTDNAENSAWPTETCLRVESGASEIDELLDNMILVCEFPGLVREIGRAAQRHVQTVHAPDRVAEAYHHVLTAAANLAVAEAHPVV